MQKFITVCGLWLCSQTILPAAIQIANDRILVTGAQGTVTLSATNGSILSMTQAGKNVSLWQSGERGLWQVKYREGGEITADAFAKGNASQSFECRMGRSQDELLLDYRSAELTVNVTLTVVSNGIALSAQLKPATKTILDFYLPARMRFNPATMERLICPPNGNMTVGTAFRSPFFQEQPLESPSAWRSKSVGPAGYASLYGKLPKQRDMRDPAVPLRVTAEGKTWLGESVARGLEGKSAVVNRPPGEGQADLVLIESEHGAYLSGSRLGGQGMLWRVGGFVTEPEESLMLRAVPAVVARVAGEAVVTRKKLGVLALTRGPERGGGNYTDVAEWVARLRQLPSVTARQVQLVELTSISELAAALEQGEFRAILNPYGECLPVLKLEDHKEMVARVGRYVRDGGHWFEVGGFSFFAALMPVRYFESQLSYPPAFADFAQLESAQGTVAVYGVQPQTSQPWEGAKRHDLIFVPGKLAWGGDVSGGYFERAFGTFVEKGTVWTSPKVLFITGRTTPENLVRYCQENRIERRLEQKLTPEALKKFKQSVLVFYTGNSQEKLAHLDKLPVPTLVHFSDYLKGGFDKEYPDHLPPNAWFGSPADLRRFFDRCHELGHLVMPYTNPTWWCDHPKGPTFEREGEAPLLKNLDGTPAYERYSKNDGYTVCHWHPAVQKVNRETVRQFTMDYPVDVLFQDQCGARTWKYDMNPASPTPYAYMDGLVSQAAEDAARMPLSTEAGWDRVVNYEAQLCGLSFQVVPTEGGPPWRKFMKNEYPPNAWQIYPVAQYIAHDKAAMLYHDLGQFVTNPEVLAWTLGLGFSMSYRISAPALERDAPREWLRWLDRLQKSVCAQYLGTPTLAFEHQQATRTGAGESIRSKFGLLTIAANLSSQPQTVDGKALAAHGFHVSGPGVVAGRLSQVNNQRFGNEGVSFVTEERQKQFEVWAYAPAETQIAVELPRALNANARVTFDGGKAQPATIQNGVVSLRLPALVGQTLVRPPENLAGKAPKDWPGGKPAIGVIDLSNGHKPNWTSIMPSAWVAALEKSPLLQRHGLAVRRLTTAAELDQALKAGSQAWLMIVNPYGEIFPAGLAGDWRARLTQIREYVVHGGHWCEAAGFSFHTALMPTGNG
ncbi:MAG: DUF6259 domain-containing protein [Verrucomicrobiota bacterium]